MPRARADSGAPGLSSSPAAEGQLILLTNLGTLCLSVGLGSARRRLVGSTGNQPSDRFIMTSHPSVFA